MNKENVGHAISAAGTGLCTMATTGSLVALSQVPGSITMWVCFGLALIGGLTSVAGKSITIYYTGKSE